MRKGIEGTVNKNLGGDMKKMKTKIAILVGITVCAILLTSPALASAGYSKIYGNANEDEVLDMRDVTYIKLVIFGKKPATDFADANYDGKISMLDIGQTKLIILGKEKQLTLVDMADRIVTVPRPVEKIVSTFPEETRVIVEVGGVDKLVGVSSYLIGDRYAPNFIMLIAYPQVKELPGVGSYREPNLEQIVTLNPDVVISGNSGPDKANIIQEKTGIPTVALSAKFDYKGEGGAFEAYRLAGKIIGNEERAGELISFINDEFDKIRDVTSEIPDSEKIKAYFCSGITRPYCTYDPIEIAGGINVAAGSGFGWGTQTTKEQVIKWNPDIILIHSTSKAHHGFGTIEDILSDPDLQSINAVKNKRVYYSKGGYVGGNPATAVTEVPYMAKLFYPEKFEDLDVDEEGNRILEMFYGVDGLYTYMQENCDLYRWE